MDRIKIKDVNLLLLVVLMLTFAIMNPYSHILILIMILAWAGSNGLKLRDFLNFNKPKASIVLFSVLIGVLLALMNFCNHFYFRSDIELLKDSKSSLSALWFLLTSCVFGSFVEELFFRGLLYNFYKRKGIFIAIVLSSGLFSMLHFDVYRIVMLFIIGVFFALLYEITQCFWILVLVHGSINGINILLELQPIAGFLKEFLSRLHEDNAELFRIKLLSILIALCILAILVMFLVMRIVGNNIFEGKNIKDFILINRNDGEPLIDKNFALVFFICVSLIVWVA